MKQFKYLLCGCDIIEDASQQIKVFDTDFRAWRIYFNYIKVRVISWKNTIPVSPDRILLLVRQTSKWSLWDVVFHENNIRQIKLQ